MLGSIVQSSMYDCRSWDHKLESQLGHITSMEMDHEIISMVILSLPQIEEGQFSVSGERMCTSSA